MYIFILHPYPPSIQFRKHWKGRRRMEIEKTRIADAAQTCMQCIRIKDATIYQRTNTMPTLVFLAFATTILSANGNTNSHLKQNDHSCANKNTFSKYSVKTEQEYWITTSKKLSKIKTKWLMKRVKFTQKMRWKQILNTLTFAQTNFKYRSNVTY